MLASDSERERALLRLRAGHVHGLLGSDTFEQRVDAALRATRRAQLQALLLDLPSRRTALRDAVTSLVAPRPYTTTIDVALPAWTDPPIVVGRSRSCDVELNIDTVSARHVELRPLLDRDRWLLIDLGSLNGTWYLNRRIGRTTVQSGDHVLLGQTAITLVAP